MDSIEGALWLALKLRMFFAIHLRFRNKQLKSFFVLYYLTFLECSKTTIDLSVGG